MSKALEGRAFRRKKAVKEEAPDTPVLEAMTSEEIFQTGRSRLDGLDLNTDPKPKQLIQETQRFIKDNKLDLVRDEEKISEFVISKIHSQKYYGPYDKTIMDCLVEDARLESMFNEASARRDAHKPSSTEWKMAERDVRDIFEMGEENNKKLSGYYNSRSLRDKEGLIKTENFKYGTLVCREEAFIASYVLHGVGIPTVSLNGFEADGGAHAFLQSRKTGARLEATSESESYSVPIYGDRDLGKGGVAYFYNDDTGDLLASGSGMRSKDPKYGRKHPDERQMALDNAQTQYAAFVNNSNNAFKAYEEKLTSDYAKHGRVRVSDVEIAMAIAAVGKDKGLAGAHDLAQREKADGLIGVREFGFKDADLKKMGVPDDFEFKINLKDVIKEFHNKMQASDVNKDGFLTVQELPMLKTLDKPGRQ